MRDVWIMLAVLVFWIALNRWILPWLGIPTCMSGGCAASACPSCGPGSGPQADKDLPQAQGDQK
jgi:hypothetical protein